MESFLAIQHDFVSQSIQGRYVSGESIKAVLNNFALNEIGRSVENRPIYSIDMGSGPIKILLWSQMHGNESTSTKGLLDVMCYLKQFPALLGHFTLKVIPMLNPDGAAAYARENANRIDLNRDAQEKSQPESKLLLYAFTDFKPDYCFNLHDQRTIFGVDGHPCMLSFLAPAADTDKTITPARRKSMGIIGHIHQLLQAHIPNLVGRFDDTFNPNCMGDYFTAQGTPTILFECGQVGSDYARKETRKWFAISLLEALQGITNNTLKEANYHAIPEVNKTFVDVLIKNVSHQGNSFDVALQYEEQLEDGKIYFVPIFHSMGKLVNVRGHKLVDLAHKNIVFEHNFSVGQNASWLAKMLDLTQYSH